MNTDTNPYTPPSTAPESLTATPASRPIASACVTAVLYSLQFLTAGVLTFFTCLYLGDKLVQWHRVGPFLLSVTILTFGLHLLSVLTSPADAKTIAIGCVPYVFGCFVVVVLFLLGWYPSGL